MNAFQFKKLCPPVAWPTAAKLLGMFLLILGSKFWILRMCNSPLPIFDQWEAEGQYLLQPWLSGNFHWGDLFTPWIQHRIVWTRLLVLGLFQINGQWDTQVEAIASELIHALAALLLGVILIRRLGRAWEDAVLLCLTILFSLPIALANTVSGGFASQYYVLLLFAVVAIWGLGSHRPCSPGWWIGVVGAISAWFSVATGPLPSLAVAGWMMLRLARREGVSRANWITLGVALALGVGGLCLSLGVEQIDSLKPSSASEFFVLFLGLLGWPNPTAWAAPLAYGPFAWLVWRTFDRRRPTGSFEAFLIPFGIFGLLNTAALTYARNHYGGLVVSRYMDFLSFGALVNFFCLLLFLRETSGEGVAPQARARVGLLALCWVAGASFGLIQLTTHNLAETLPSMKMSSQHQVENLAAFVARPDLRKLAAQKSFDNLCDNPKLASVLLQDAQIRQILPAQVRPPVVLDASSESPLVHRAQSATPGDDGNARWVLEPSHNNQPVHFQSHVISDTRLPYLRFYEVSDLGGDAFIGLVEEQSGATTWLQQDGAYKGPQTILVKAPAGPFHVEAVIAAGSNRPLTFSYPREVGMLSAWVEPLLGSSALFLFAGSALWLSAVFWRRLGLHLLGSIRVRLPEFPWRKSAAPEGERTRAISEMA